MYHAAKAVHKEHKLKKSQLKATEAAGKVAAQQIQQQPQERDFVADDYDIFTRDFDDDDLSARMFEEFRQKYRQAKASRLQQKYAKAAAKAGGGDVSERDLEEELEMRDLNDDLSARMFERFRQKYREAKATRLQKEFAKANAKAGGGGGPTEVATGDITYRDVDDGLDARSFGDMWRAVRAESPEKKALRLQRQAELARGKAAAAAVSRMSNDGAAGPPMEARDIFEVLYDRDFEEIDELD